LQPRKFFIEDWLESYKNSCECNLGESGYKNYSLNEILAKLKIDNFDGISLADSPNRGSALLRKEISKLYNNIPIENILITTGTSEALYLLFQILLKRKDLVSLFSPAFQALYEIPKMIGAKIKTVDVKDSLDLQKLFAIDSKLYIINHPHNPTGIGLKKSELEKYISRDKNILFDEHYRFLSFKKNIGFSGYKNQKNIFATGSITKCFGVTGLRIGWLLADPEFIEKARDYKDYITHTVNPISEFLAIKVLQNWKELIQPIQKNILQNINLFQKTYRNISGIKNFRKPDSGLVSFIELENGIDSEAYAKTLLQDCSVFVLPGIQFEKEGFIRIGFGEDCEKFRLGIERWKKRFQKKPN
jgi:aspartate/methionine/tyrosine aminotransferase